jgi:hypothetical protein
MQHALCIDTDPLKHYHSVWASSDWDPPPPLPQPNVSPPEPKGGGVYTLVCGWGGSQFDVWRKSLALCLLCEVANTFHLTALYYHGSSVCIFLHKQLLWKKSVFIDILTNIKNCYLFHQRYFWTSGPKAVHTKWRTFEYMGKIMSQELLQIWTSSRDHWMIYRGPGFLAFVRFGSSPTLSFSSN